jgi:hypothetical protein
MWGEEIKKNSILGNLNNIEISGFSTSIPIAESVHAYEY